MCVIVFAQGVVCVSRGGKMKERKKKNVSIGQRNFGWILNGSLTQERKESGKFIQTGSSITTSELNKCAKI